MTGMQTAKPLVPRMAVPAVLVPGPGEAPPVETMLEAEMEWTECPIE